MAYCYYIYAPRFVPTSAGIVGLYELVLKLREAGQQAWIITYRDHTQDQLPEKFHNTILSYEQALVHRRSGFSAIVVYSETVDGNPLKAKVVVRYIMNVPGLLGGPKTYSAGECLYAFSETLAEMIGRPDWSLFLPLVDEARFVPGTAQRTLTCVYAAKYRQVHVGIVDKFPEGTVEISRDLAISQDSTTVLALLQASKRLYLYENSAIAIEAALCGCVVIFIPNPYLEISIGEKDHGNAGMAWGNSPEEISRAEKSLPQFRADYLRCKAALPERLALFVARTRAYRQQISGFGMDVKVLKPPEYVQLAGFAAERYLKLFGWRGLIVKATEVLTKRGPLTAIRIIISFTAKLMSS